MGQLDYLLSILESLREATVLVEGKRDVKALRNLGITAIPVAGKDLNTLELSGKVVVLTDLDRRGNLLARQIKAFFEPTVKVDTETRIVLAGILKLKRFEEIDAKFVEFVTKSLRGGEKWAKRILTPSNTLSTQNSRSKVLLKSLMLSELSLAKQRGFSVRSWIYENYKKWEGLEE